MHVPAAPGRPTILALHGWVMNRSAWADAAFPLLADGIGLLLPDLPGHGDAKPLPSSIGPRDFFPEIARRLVAGLDALGLQRVHLAGYSMGAAAAVSVLQIAPERVERTFLLGPLVGSSTGQLVHNSWATFSRLCGNIGRALQGPRNAALLRVAPGLGLSSAALPDALIQRTADAFADGAHLPSESTFAPYTGTPATATELEVFLEGLVRTDLRTTLRSLRASSAVPYRRVLAGPIGPISYATGELDALSPVSFVRRLSRLTPSADGHVHVLDGVDHVALSQAPAQVTQLLLGWLGEQPSARGLHAVAASGKVTP